MATGGERESVLVGPEADQARALMRATRRRRIGPEDTGTGALRALVRMLDTPPVTDEPEHER